MHFFTFGHLRNYTSKFIPHLRHKFHAPSLPLSPIIFSYLQTLIHGFLWWWACSWLIFTWSGISNHLSTFSIPLSLIFKKQRTPLMKKIQGLQSLHGATLVNHSLLEAQQPNTLVVMILTIYLMLFWYYCLFSMLNIMFMVWSPMLM